MLSFFANRQFKDVESIVSCAIADEMSPNRVLSDVDRMYLAKTVKMITRPRLKALPKNVRDQCQNFMLAAFVLLGEAALHAKEIDGEESAQMYLRAAKKLTLSLAPMMSEGDFPIGDIRLMKVLQEIAKGSGLEFGTELLENQ